MLTTLGFDPFFISSINMLFTNAFIVLTINGYQYESIFLSCYVHKGYPLDPSLFMLATKAFSYLLSHQASQGLIRGISLPNSQVQLLNGHFVDDSFLTLQEDEQSIKTYL